VLPDVDCPGLVESKWFGWLLYQASKTEKPRKALHTLKLLSPVCWAKLTLIGFCRHYSIWFVSGLWSLKCCWKNILVSNNTTPVTSPCAAFKEKIELIHASSLLTKGDFDVKNDTRPWFNIIHWWKNGLGIVKAKLESSFTGFSLKGTQEANQRLCSRGTCRFNRLLIVRFQLSFLWRKRAWLWL